MSKALAPAAALLLASATLLVARPPASAAEHTELIAYASGYVRDAGLFVVRPRRITRRRSRGEVNVNPAWSPDGRRIAFSSTRTPENPEIWTVRPDGGGLRRLTRTPGGVEVLGDDGMPAWAPDGRLLAFVSNRTGDGEVWLMRSDGRGQRRLAGTRRLDDWAPEFSPDGRRLVFGSLGAGGDSRLSVVGADGRGLMHLGVRGVDPSWRPAGRT